MLLLVPQKVKHNLWSAKGYLEKIVINRKKKKGKKKRVKILPKVLKNRVFRKKTLIGCVILSLTESFFCFAASKEAQEFDAFNKKKEKQKLRVSYRWKFWFFLARQKKKVKRLFLPQRKQVVFFNFTLSRM